MNTILEILFCVAGSQMICPSLQKLTQLIIVGVPVLLVEVFHTVGFNNHILSYSITDSYTSSVISISKLDSKQPSLTHKSIGGANIYIILRYHHFPRLTIFEIIVF